MMHVKTKYLDEKAHVVFGRYGNGDPAIELISEIGEPLTTATVNLEEYGIHPEPGNIIIKTAAENSGVLEALQSAGYVGEAVRSYSYGYVKDGAVECPLTALAESKIAVLG